jgi:phage/plasmid-associated DNA primase
MNLFDIIFKDGYISEERYILSTTKFQELFDHNKLAFILLNEKAIKDDISRKARDEVELTSYYKKAHKYNDTVANVSVCYYQPANKLYGRYQARGKLSGQGILREVRHTIYADYYYDLDMVNAHPVILLWLCNIFKIDCECLNEYVVNREQHIADITNLNSGVSRDDVKAIFLSINNGGLADYKKLKNKTPFLKNYKNEVHGLIDNIVSRFEPFYEIVKNMKQSRGQDFNIGGAAISHILQYIENQLLMIIFKFLEERIADKVYNSILCYDGIMILKNHYNSDWQSELETLFSNEYGIDIKLKIKEMQPLDLTKYGFEEEQRYKLNYEDSVISFSATEFSSYKTILDNQNVQKELMLINSTLYELDVVQYLRAYNEEYIFAGGHLHRFNGIYWEIIDSEYIYNLLEIVHVKLKRTIENDETFQDKRKVDALKRIGALKKQSYSKSLYEYIKSKYSKMENPLNKNIYLIGFKNGVYDLEINEFRSASKFDYISYVVPYNYESSSDEDIQYVKDYISKIMPMEDERELLLLILSTCLSGHVLEHFIVCTGLGSNGKDTLFNYMLKEALGPYFYRASNTVLTQKASSDLNVGIANMDKKRAILFSETSDASTINCALIKELTGGNEINARGLYSSNTTVHLHSTMIMLCNDKPMLDKVDEAIARRLITFRFRSIFKSQEYVEKAGLKEGLLNKDDSIENDDSTENDSYLFIGDNAVKSSKFLEQYRLPFLNLLLPYFQEFKRAGFNITNIPESIKAQSRKYMEESDQLYAWFSDSYEPIKKEPVNGKIKWNLNEVISLKDVFANLKESEYYGNLTKQDKRKLTYASLIEYVVKSPLLRLYYKDRMKVDNATRRGILVGFKLKE